LVGQVISRRIRLAEAPTSRDKILDVADALFARRGYAGVGLREVADAARLSKSSLFHHFRSKEQLYHEVILRVLLRIRERFDADVVRTDSPRARLERWIEELIDTLAEHPTAPRLLLRSLFEEEEAASPEAESTEALLASIIGDAERLIRRGIECGELRRVSAPHTLLTLIGATVFHFASAEMGEQILGRPLFSAEEVARRKREVIALLRHGLFERADQAPAGAGGGS
jgi:AcrR family transcriptional regulator